MRIKTVAIGEDPALTDERGASRPAMVARLIFCSTNLSEQWIAGWRPCDKLSLTAAINLSQRLKKFASAFESQRGLDLSVLYSASIGA